MDINDTVKTLEKTDTASWAYVPAVLNRIKKFCGETNADYPIKEMQNLFLQALIADEPAIKVMVVLNENGGVIGHLIGSLEKRFDKYYLAILQYSLDRKVDRKLLKDSFESLCAWARGYGIDEAFLTTFDEKRIRMFRRFWGFEKYRFTMKRKI